MMLDELEEDDVVVYGGDLSMTPEYLCQDCGTDDARFCCPINVLTCHTAIESTLGDENREFFGKDLAPYLEKAPGNRWSHLPEVEKKELLTMFTNRMLPDLKGIKQVRSIDDIPDDTTFNVIKLKPNESIEDLAIIFRRASRKRNVEFCGKFKRRKNCL